MKKINFHKFISGILEKNKNKKCVYIFLGVFPTVGNNWKKKRKKKLVQKFEVCCKLREC